MTAPFEIEIEEDRVIPIENSHLSRGRCACGATALIAPGRRPRCGTCLMKAADEASVYVPLAAAFPGLGQGYPPAPEHGRDDYPAPKITSRDEWAGGDAPAAVTSLAEKARAAGWRVRVQRSRGCAPNASTGRPGAVKTTYAVVIGNGRYGAYGVRDETAWQSVMLWGHDRPWFSLANVTELGQYIAAGGEMPETWYAGVRQRVAEAEQRKKDRDGCDKGLHLGRYLSSLPFIGPFKGATAGWWCGLCKHSWLASAEVWKKPKKGKADTAR